MVLHKFYCYYYNNNNSKIYVAPYLTECTMYNLHYNVQFVKAMG